MNTWRRQNQSRAGFTLIELMISIAVMGIIIASVPTFRSWRTINETNTAIRVIAQDLRLARSVAVDRSMDTIVSFDADTNSYSVYYDSDGDGPEVGDLHKTVSLNSLGPGMEYGILASKTVNGGTPAGPIMLSGSGTPTSITFRPNGQAVHPGSVYLLHTGTTGTVALDRSRAVDVQTTGQVQTYRWTGDLSNPWSVFY